MPLDGAALLDVDRNENVSPNQAQRLSRSPHPYHRHRANVLQDDGTPSAQPPNAFHSPTFTSSQPNNAKTEATYFDVDHRRRRRQSSSPSDSGTEADDEKGGSLLGLPAPPTKLRKGLKGANYSGTASPLLTPSYLDEEPRRFALKIQSRRRASLQSQSCTDEETGKIREKFTRRRRAELIRRMSETILLGFVGFVACRADTGLLVRLYANGTLQPGRIVAESGIVHVPIVLLIHAAVVLGLYMLYPFRIIYKNHARNASRHRSRFYIHIPAAFEPAPLLYPILVPVFVGLSLMPADATVLLPNLVLSIASVPSKIIPFNADLPWYSSLQWLCSAGPVLVSQQLCLKDCRARPGKDCVKRCISDAENLLWLYPLHEALLPALGYLTTTSLLSAELQLLSISMINLLLRSTSPQTVILQSLLWIGGLSIFILCGKVLSWGVALARIPSWRFRRSIPREREGNTLLLAIDDCLHGRLSKWGMVPADSDDSDGSELEEIKRPPRINARKKHRQMLSVDARRVPANGCIKLARIPNSPASAIQDSQPAVFPGVNGSFNALRPDPDHKRQRRYTLPSSVGSPPASPSVESLKRSRTTQFQPAKSWSLRSFSKAQAAVVKWLFALYVYTVVIALVVLTIKPFVARKALLGQEPVGWALGYLLGDIPLFRGLVINWNLDPWVGLPESLASYSFPKTYSWPQLQESLGGANIRLLICVYCLAIIVIGLGVVFRLSAVAEVDTRRKVFHGMMVVMFLPTIFVDPPFVSLALVLTMAIFLLLDLFRASQLPPLSQPLTYFLAPYVDGRDHRGPVIVSHIFLLIGCAIPLWLSLAAIERTGRGSWEGWDVQRREVSMVSGVVCVGMGDAAASLIGRRYGRRRWCWSGGKSLEGSLAFAVAVVLGLSFARLWLLIGGWSGDSGDSWATTLGKTSIAAIGASLTEAVLTGGNDNVIVPVILWLLVRGLRI